MSARVIRVDEEDVLADGVRYVLRGGMVDALFSGKVLDDFSYDQRTVPSARAGLVPKRQATIARCWGCGFALAWKKSTGRIDDFACPSCGSDDLRQTSLAYRRTFWVLHPASVDVIKWAKGVAVEARRARMAERIERSRQQRAEEEAISR